MSGAKHTPGPWEVKTSRHPDTDGSRWGWVEAFPHPEGRAGSPPSGIGVITWSGRQGLANARLIAAAPQLLEALEAIEAWLRPMVGTGGDSLDRAHEQVRTAIRAARGETP